MTCCLIGSCPIRGDAAAAAGGLQPAVVAAGLRLEGEEVSRMATLRSHYADGQEDQDLGGEVKGLEYIMRCATGRASGGQLRRKSWQQPK